MITMINVYCLIFALIHVKILIIIFQITIFITSKLENFMEFIINDLIYYKHS
jgi:hypothetical protein